MPLDPQLLAILACPICKGPLTEQPQRLNCAFCRKDFPVENGIPNLL